MKLLAVIPARGGSKGIPGKNIKPLNGKPLIYYTIEAARAVFEDHQIIVSTDEQAIIDVVEKTGLKVPFKRPAELATDEAGSYEVILHAMDWYEKQIAKVDAVVLLQSTSPFRTGQHIKEALDLFDDACDMVVSVAESKANPYYTLMEEGSNGWLTRSKQSAFTRRQDCPPVYELNGAVYVINRESLQLKPIHEMQKIRKYVMPAHLSIDLDTPMDWAYAELILATA